MAFDPSALEYTRLMRSGEAFETPPSPPVVEVPSPPEPQRPDPVPSVPEPRGTVGPWWGWSALAVFAVAEGAVVERWEWYRDKTRHLHPVTRKLAFGAACTLGGILVCNAIRRPSRLLGGTTYDCARLATFGVFR